MNHKKPLEIYVHIPFCARKCLYCDFLSFPVKQTEAEGRSLCRRYIEALLLEIERTAQMVNITSCEVQSVFFGGGTPSYINEVYIKEILCELHLRFTFSEDAEITIECNPGTLNKQKLLTYREAGINRLSIGLQSTDNEELKKLGRIHTYQDFLTGYRLAREAGFDNINIDLMTALPGQTMEQLLLNLERVTALQPEHISAYSLIIEEGTPYASMYTEENLPSEELDREMYAETGRLLEQAGYHRYEISNYAKPGRECRHNTGYWRRTPYLGFGLGASSLYRESRWKNEDDMEQYLTSLTQGLPLSRTEEQQLTVKMQMEEFMFLGLRMTDGVTDVEFEDHFGRKIEEIYGTQIEKLIQEELLTLSVRDTHTNIRLTMRGLDLSNYVFSQFI